MIFYGGEVMKLMAEKVLSPFFLGGWNISKDEEFDVEFVEAQQFLRSERLDLISKLLYIDCREKGKQDEFIEDLYGEFIKAFSSGTYIEPGTESKNSLEKYFESFNDLIDNIKENGFQVEKSVVPVGENGSILDGSHRTAIAIYFGLKLPIIRIPKISKNYNYLYFRDKGMEEKYLDYSVMKYIEMSKHCYVACLWPRARGRNKINEAEQLLYKSTNIVYEKKVKFNYNGIRQFMIHIYGHQPWAGTLENNYSGIPLKAKSCYRIGSYTKIFILDGSTLEEIIKVKSKIRDIFKVENHSVHITDTKQEAVEASRILLNENSIDFLNYGNITKPYELVKYILNNADKHNKELLSPTVVKTMYELKKDNLNITQDNCWIYRDEEIDVKEYGYVYDILFSSLENCDLTHSEKCRLFFTKIKKGLLIDIITRLEIGNHIRHIGGKILRKLKVIR